MLHSLFNKLDSLVNFKTASAHCDIPCGIYDPTPAQIDTLSVIRFSDQLEEIYAKDSLSPADQSKIVRLVREKEIHAKQVKDAINVIWGDFYKQAQFDAYPNLHDLVHSIMMAASACKQHNGRDKGVHLLGLVNEFAEIFWAIKKVETYRATCPYAPAEETVYPKLG